MAASSTNYRRKAMNESFRFLTKQLSIFGVQQKTVDGLRYGFSQFFYFFVHVLVLAV